jgi:hypothetical protein
MWKPLLAAGAACALLGLAACDNGSAEKTGENLDSAVENATQGHENTSDGPLEQAGESVDRAAGSERQDSAADAINDATDGKSSTHP